LKILAIDTSSIQASAAIVAVEMDNAADCNATLCVEKYIPNIHTHTIIGEIFLNARTGEKQWTHSEILMPGVESLFELTRIQPQEIDYVAYSCGPGSFTGLRIGAACALGVARALERPAIGIPTLDALAYNMHGAGGEAQVVPMLDARRGQVYTAVYFRDADGGLKNQFKDEKVPEFIAMIIPTLVQQLVFNRLFRGQNDKPIILLGDGASAYEKEIRQAFESHCTEGASNVFFAPANNNRVRASSVAMCAANKIVANCDVFKIPENRSAISSSVEILYVRAPQAVREMEERAKINTAEQPSKINLSQNATFYKSEETTP